MRLASTRQPAGFTLLEVTIIVVILGLLAGIVVPSVIGILEREQIRTTRIELKNIADVIKGFQLDNSRLPDETEGLTVLWTQPDDTTDTPNWRQYLDGPPGKDAWGNEYVYELGEAEEDGTIKTFTLRSLGPNRNDDQGGPDDIVWPEPVEEEGVG